MCEKDRVCATERGECKNMKNKKEKKQEEEELTGMAAVWDYLKTFLIIFCVVFAMNKLVYINAVIPSESMQNTIMKGDRVLGNRLAYIKDDPERYDIVIFKYPDDPSKIFIKLRDRTARRDSYRERREDLH